MTLRIMIFATLFTGARGVEIAQRSITQTIRLVIPAQRVLKREFRFAVGIGWAVGIGFFYGLFFRFAVGGCSRGKDKLGDPGFAHRLKQRQAGDNVIAIILRRLFT